MRQPLISVIVPSYKPQGYLYECLISLAEQTMAKEQFEVLLILNGCEEPYQSWIKLLIQERLTNLNIHFIQTGQGGVSNARNLGLNMAKGAYITFIDDDDSVSPSYLQEMYEIALAGYLPVSNIIFYREGMNISQPHGMTDLFKKNCEKGERRIMHLRSFFSVPYCKLIPRYIIAQRRFDCRFNNGEDALFMFLISDRIGKIKLTSFNAYYYRRCRPGSARNNKLNVHYKFRLVGQFIRIYFTHPYRYNFLFFITRLLAPFKENFSNGLSIFS